MKFETDDKAWLYYYRLSRENFEKTFKELKLDNSHISKLEGADLLKIETQILDLLNSPLFITANTYAFKLGTDFIIEDDSANNLVGYIFSIKNQLNRKLDSVRELIIKIDQTKTVENINTIVSSITNEDIKAKLEEEFKELKEQIKSSLENTVEKPTDLYLIRDETELRKGKMEMMDKWSEIILKFIDRESVASIVGSLLLLIIGVCLVVVMFRHEQPLKIIESAFLLILGYFFGHSKNNK